MNRFQRILIFSLLILARNTYGQGFKIDSLLRSLQTEKVDTLRIKTSHRIARYFLDHGQYDSSYKYALLSYTHAVKINYKKAQAYASNTIGTCLNHFGKTDSSIYYFEISLKLYQDKKDTAQIASAYNNMGNVYKRTGNLSKCLEYYFKALQLKESVDDQMGVSRSLYNISSVYSQLNDTANALKFILKSLDYAMKVGDSAHIANVYMCVGLRYKDNSAYDKALIYLSEAVRMSKQTGDRELVAIAAYNLGSYQFDRQDFRGAEINFKSALDYALTNQDTEGIASCYQALGQIAHSLGKEKESLSYYEKSIEAAKRGGIAELQMNVHELLYLGYEHSGSYEKALQHYKSWREFKDSLFNAESVRKMTRTELNYEHEKEKLLLAAEQQKKDAIATERDKKKNILVTGTILFLVLLIAFSFILYRRLQENRRQKAVIETQNTEILDSIKYAQKIQNALLADEQLIRNHVKDLFVIFRPKDIVSGDFYWASRVADKNTDLFYLAVCDSTGHGVPGAFMSVLNVGLLSEAILEKEIREPGEVFNFIRRKLVENISQEGQKDGMDGMLLCFDLKTRKVTYAAANLNPVIVRRDEMLNTAYDKMPVGKGEKDMPFSTFELDLQAGDRFYLYTDGFADQFGGPKGKKFMYKQLNQTLVTHAGFPMQEQSGKLNKIFDDWKGTHEQVDDVCVIGIQYS